MASVAKRRPGEAMTPDRRRWETSREIFRCYDHDQAFRHALGELWAGDSPGGPAQADIRQFCTAWGLDRFPDDHGEQAVRSWCERRSATGSERAVVFDVAHMLEDLPPGGVDYVVRVELTDHWDPEDEPRTKSPFDPGARARLIAAATTLIDAELDRIASETEQGGATFADTQHERDRHLDWTYRRLAYRCHALDLVDDDALVYEGAVRKATERIADVLGIDAFPPAKRRA